MSDLDLAAGDLAGPRVVGLAAGGADHLGHQVQLIIGDFTGRIGDPTGKSETRKQLSEEDVKRNAETYQKQIFKILDPDRTTIHYNSTWLAPMTFADGTTGGAEGSRHVVVAIVALALGGFAIGTTFDDQATRSIVDVFNNARGATAPFTGHFRPEGGVSLLNAYGGATPAQLNGIWTLQVTDSRASGTPPPAQSVNAIELTFTSGLTDGPDSTVATTLVRGNVNGGGTIASPAWIRGRSVPPPRSTVSASAAGPAPVSRSATRAEVTVHKPAAPIPLPFGDVVVTIRRGRG